MSTAITAASPYTRGGVVASLVCTGAAAGRLPTIASTPTRMLNSTANRSVTASPATGTKNTPASKLPTAAPSEFTAYSDASVPFAPARFRVSARVIAGNEPPMSNVGGSTVTAASTMRAGLPPARPTFT